MKNIVFCILVFITTSLHGKSIDVLTDAKKLWVDDTREAIVISVLESVSLSCKSIVSGKLMLATGIIFYCCFSCITNLLSSIFF